MPEFAVSTKYTAVDGLTSAHNRMGASATRLGRTIKTSMNGADAAMGTMGQTAKGVFLGGAMVYGTMALQQGVAGLAREVLDLDSNLTQAGAKFDVPIKRGTAAFKELERVAKDVGATTQFTAGQAAQGLDFLAMAGFDAAQAMSALPGLAELATAANIDLGRASDMAADSLGAFGLMTKDPTELANNLQRVSDVFAKTANISTVSMESLYETMQQAGPVSKTAGADIETFAAAAGMLGSAAIKGGEAGTTLKNIFLKLAGPVPKASALLQKLGVKTQDSAGNMRDMFDILGDLSVATKGMGTATRSAAMDTLFGKYAVAGANVLLDKGGDELKRYRQMMYEAKGSTKSMSEEMRKSLTVRLEILKSTLMDKGLNIINALTGGKDPGATLDKITKWVSEIDVNKVISIGKSVAQVAAGFMAFRAASGVVGTISSLAAALPMLANPAGIAAAAIGGIAAAAMASGVQLSTVTDIIEDDFGPAASGLQTTLNGLGDTIGENEGGIRGLVTGLISLASSVWSLPLDYLSWALEKVRFGFETWLAVVGKVRSVVFAVGGAIGWTFGKLSALDKQLQTSIPLYGKFRDALNWVGGKLAWIGRIVGEKYKWVFDMIWGGGAVSSALNVATGGALDEARSKMAQQDSKRALDAGWNSAAAAASSAPAGDFTGNLGQSGTPAPMAITAQTQTTVNLNITGLPQGMTATAETPNRTAPPVNMALAGAR
jgi:TP901 family phage tail tape measure protein